MNRLTVLFVCVECLREALAQLAASVLRCTLVATRARAARKHSTQKVLLLISYCNPMRAENVLPLTELLHHLA